MLDDFFPNLHLGKFFCFLCEKQLSDKEKFTLTKFELWKLSRKILLMETSHHLYVSCPSPWCGNPVVMCTQPDRKIFHGLSERHNGDPVEGPLKSLGTIVPWCSGRFRGPLIWPSWWRKPDHCRNCTRPLFFFMEKKIFSESWCENMSSHLEDYVCRRCVYSSKA